MNKKFPLRLAFMGTPAFAGEALKALNKAGHLIVAVYCQPPKPAGRGQKLQKTPVHLIAETLNIPVYTPKTLRDVFEQERFRSLQLDVAIVAAYGLILPTAILAAPQKGCINIHASLLPRWRGAAPIQRALLEGDRETGITIMAMDEGLDTGPILMRESTPITDTTTAQSLQEELALIGSRLIVATLNDLSEDRLHPMPQPNEGACYAKKLTREEGRIDWRQPAHEIERKIRALSPWPGCFFMHKNESIKLLAASVVEGPSSLPGTLLNDLFTVACGKDALQLMTVQRPGKSVTDGPSFLRGLRIQPGFVL